MHNQSGQHLRVLPVQLVDHPDGVILKRGCTELKVSGEGAKGVVETILGAMTEKGATCEELCAQFPSAAQATVLQLVEQLVARRILVPADAPNSASHEVESSLDIFYWHFDHSAESVVSELSTKRLTILGVNCVSRQLLIALAASGVQNFEVIDYPFLRNLRLFHQTGCLKAEDWPLSKAPIDYMTWFGSIETSAFDCLIATSDFGFTSVLSEWNKFCVERGRHFLPIVLNNLVGYIGPLTIPGETACFDCLRARENSHFDDPATKRATEAVAFQGQVVVGFHPLMASSLGDIAAFELIKFYSGTLTRPHIGFLTEVNLLATRLTSRKVLKLPRCPTCTPLKAPSTVNSKKVILSRGKLCR